MKNTKTLSRFAGGIGEFDRESSLQDAYAMGQSIDVRTNPQNLTLLPRTIKESGTVITALPKWGEYISSCDKTYVYDEAGSIYERNSSGTYSLLHTTPSSHGNGMSWFGEDNFIYYTSDKLIGRYGPVCSSSATFVDDFFGSQGGTPLNTNSLDLESGSTQYASRADTASLSVTGNLSIQTWIKPESLPTAGNQMTLVSKWTEASNKRSYKFFIGTSSNFFGDGSDGALTISSNTTEAPIDSACTGTSGAYTLTATNASFAAGQIIYIHQTQGTGAGQDQLNKIQSYTAGTITLVDPLNATYTTGAQVRVVKQYTDVTINSGFTYTAKAWDGTVGGIIGFLCSGTFTYNGTLTATGCGFRGADRPAATSYLDGKQGESYASSTYNTATYTANYGGGGGGQGGASGGAGNGGGGGSYAAIGADFTVNGATSWGGYGAVGSGSKQIGNPGAVYGSQDLTAALFLGSGGGSGGNSYNASTDGGSGGAGGNGGGIVMLGAVTITSGSGGAITANGNQGQVGNFMHANGGGGGGSGGAILLYYQTATLGTSLITASGGLGGYNTNGFALPGGSGGVGRIHGDYLTSTSGTTTPTLYTTQDPNLGSSVGYTLNLSISSNGTNVETYSKPADLVTGSWQNATVVWDSSISTAEFYLTGVSLGTQVGALTTINDNNSVFNVGRDLDSSSTTQHLYDGLIDSVRVFAGYLTATDITSTLYRHISTTSLGLVAYYKFNADATDSTSNANDLTLTGSPVYSTDVPFAAPTTRVDIDQNSATSGNTYALTTAISEASTDKKSFTPAKDPQKSLRIYIGAKGTGAWTLTVHDQYNNTIATSTVANASLPSSGDYEFIFSTPWRPLTNFTNSYHFHLTSTVADGTVRTTSSNNLSTVDFTTYYSFLIEDTAFHPVAKMLQFLVFGNERYIGTLEATVYDPNKIALPAGYRVRCFGYWQEYLAIGVIKGDSITDQDQGRIYFWDGIATTYNSYVDVPQGGVSALLGKDGKLFVWAGYNGDMLVYEGGNSVRKLRRLPNLETTKYLEMYPGAVTGWNSLIHYGAGGSSNSALAYRGVYAYGSTNDKYPDILTFDYPISTGNTKNTPRIGLLMTVEDRLLIGWGDGTGYGVDYVDTSNDVYPTGFIEFLIDDTNNVWKEKLLNVYVAKFAPLSSGQSITLKHKLDSDTSWTYGATVTSSSNDTDLARFLVTNQRFSETQIGVDIATTVATSPTLKGVGVEIDDLRKEGRV